MNIVLAHNLVCQQLVSCARLCGGHQKKSGQCCTHSVTTAGMLAEPIRLLCTLVLCQKMQAKVNRIRLAILYCIMAVFYSAVGLMFLVH